jgi:hypothetical protein
LEKGDYFQIINYFLFFNKEIMINKYLSKKRKVVILGNVRLNVVIQVVPIVCS